MRFVRSVFPSFPRTTASAPPALASSPTVASCLPRSREAPAIVTDGALKNGSFSPRLLKRGDFSVAERAVSVVLAFAPVEKRYFVFRSRTPSSTVNFTRSSKNGW